MSECSSGDERITRKHDIVVQVENSLARQYWLMH